MACENTFAYTYWDIRYIYIICYLVAHTMTHLYHIHFSYTYSCLCVSYFIFYYSLFYSFLVIAQHWFFFYFISFYVLLLFSVFAIMRWIMEIYTSEYIQQPKNLNFSRAVCGWQQPYTYQIFNFHPSLLH